MRLTCMYYFLDKVSRDEETIIIPDRLGSGKANQSRLLG